MKPSDLVQIYPWDSVTQSAESETTACCIVQYLAQNGDQFRVFTFEEYQVRHPRADKERFENVIKYFKSEDTVRLFSKEYDL